MPDNVLDRIHADTLNSILKQTADKSVFDQPLCWPGPFVATEPTSSGDYLCSFGFHIATIKLALTKRTRARVVVEPTSLTVPRPGSRRNGCPYLAASVHLTRG